jgi:inosine-uridine nucleoside N-ribohydrolase
VTLGPLTNIAFAMKLNKNFERNVKNLVTMGGTMEGVGGITPTSGISKKKFNQSNYFLFNKTNCKSLRCLFP